MAYRVQAQPAVGPNTVVSDNGQWTGDRGSSILYGQESSYVTSAPNTELHRVLIEQGRLRGYLDHQFRELMYDCLKKKK